MERLEAWTREAEAESKALRGPGRTPYVLDRLSQVSGRATLAANRALLLQNASVAAGIANAFSKSHSPPG
jgi:pseudouridine-5'-phosphate glycosidase